MVNRPGETGGFFEEGGGDGGFRKSVGVPGDALRCGPETFVTSLTSLLHCWKRLDSLVQLLFLIRITAQAWRYQHQQTKNLQPRMKLFRRNGSAVLL